MSNVTTPDSQPPNSPTASRWSTRPTMSNVPATRRQRCGTTRRMPDGSILPAKSTRHSGTSSSRTSTFGRIKGNSPKTTTSLPDLDRQTKAQPLKAPTSPLHAIPFSMYLSAPFFTAPQTWSHTQPGHEVAKGGHNVTGKSCLPCATISGVAVHSLGGLCCAPGLQACRLWMIM